MERGECSVAFFPDSGVIRDVSLSLVVATIFLLAEFLALLLYQWFKSPRRLDDIRFVWSILVVSFVVLFFHSSFQTSML
ncbi:MAG: hypothetical protein QW461_01050 [Candidatus Jordarchaeales archaeon]